jgi:hypothetical protein
LADELGGRVQLGAHVEAAVPRGREVVLRIAGEERGPYAAAVLAVSAPAAAELVAEVAPTLASDLRAFPHAPIAAVHLGFARAEIEHPLDGFGFLVAADEEPAILGAVFESSIFPARAPAGQVLVRAMIGGAHRPELAFRSDDELVELARAELGRVLGVRAEPSRARVTRWRQGIPQYTLGHGERVQRAENAASALGLILAGSAYRGVAVNKLVADGARVAAGVLQRLGALAAVLLGLVLPLGAALTAAGCSGGQLAPGASDDGAGEARPRPYEVIESREADRETGAIAITVRWLPAPPELVASPGVNACGMERRPPLRVDTMGAVEGAVATLVDIREGRAHAEPAPSAVSIEACRAEPRVSIASAKGSPLEILSRDERPQQVTLSYAGPLLGGAGDAEPLAEFALPLVGQRVQLAAPRDGIYVARTTASPNEEAYVVVPPHPYAAITDDLGEARLNGVPVGRYELKIWHPPVTPGGEPLTRRASVQVVADEEAEISIALGGDAAPEREGGGEDGDDE